MVQVTNNSSDIRHILAEGTGLDLPQSLSASSFQNRKVDLASLLIIICYIDLGTPRSWLSLRWINK